MDASFDSALDADPAVGDELAPGTSLCQGQYTVVRYLNMGGFGVTYLAHDSLGRKVVIKECYPGAMCCRTGGTVRLRSRSHGGDFDRVVSLFEREALALAQLEHPNIVGVHQIFKDNGTAYMAMDFVDGPDLFDVMETRPELLDPPEIRRILDQLLEALAFVHKNGMLHRDISPDNILLGPESVPVLIDFGAAREGAARATRMLSRIHTVKDGYSPQEFYVAGSEQGKSSDLYALAATMHHLIVGRAPPNSNIRLAAVAQKATDPYQPLTGRIASYDDRFLGAIDRCLSLFARNRLPTAEAWIEALRATSAGPAKAPAPVILSDDVARRISELVQETSSLIEAAEDPVAATQVAACAPTDPQEEARAARRAAEREYWAILNEDPRAIRAEVERAEALQRAREEQEAAALAKAEAKRRGDAGNRARGLILSPRIGAWFSGLLSGLLSGRRAEESEKPMPPLKEIRHVNIPQYHRPQTPVRSGATTG